MDWISVDDRLPGREEPVLITDSETVSMEMLSDVNGGEGHIKLEWCSCVDLTPINCELPVTHWMYLPAPPDEIEFE